MSKEVLRPEQFRRAKVAMDDMVPDLTDEQKKQLEELYEGVATGYSQGSIVTGAVKEVSPEGVLIDIGYKADGLIPLYEFAKHELKKFQDGAGVEVMLEELETLDGGIKLSYEKAKLAKAWDTILRLFEEGKPVEGVITHKVKGGVSVDIGVSAFLPGSQIDVQRVADFDQLIGQAITAYIIKVNRKRGNIIISRRKYLAEKRADQRRKILETLEVDSVVQGTVKNITNYGVFIDVGGVDGLLHITDMTWGRIAHPSEMVKIGQPIAVKVLAFDKASEKISLGLKQLSENPWDALPETIEEGARIKGVISSVKDYGLFVEVVPGVEGLVHISQVSWTDRITDLHKQFRVGQEIEAYVVSLDKAIRRMSLSIKKLSKNPWDEIAEQYQAGQSIRGPVSNVTEFGIFVQIMPGIDGLVHISDFSWTEHIEHPADRYKKGQEVDAVILNIAPDQKKVSLGIKQLEQNPWDAIDSEYPVGTVVKGEVAKITNFGAFVRLPNGVEGLTHISDFPQAKDKLEVGKEYSFRVSKINKEERKLALKPVREGAEDAYEERARRPQERPHRDMRRSSTRTGSEAVKSPLQLELERHAARQKSAQEAGKASAEDQEKEAPAENVVEADSSVEEGQAND